MVDGNDIPLATLVQTIAGASTLVCGWYSATLGGAISPGLLRIPGIMTPGSIGGDIGLSAGRRSNESQVILWVKAILPTTNERSSKVSCVMHWSRTS